MEDEVSKQRSVHGGRPVQKNYVNYIITGYLVPKVRLCEFSMACHLVLYHILMAYFSPLCKEIFGVPEPNGKRFVSICDSTVELQNKSSVCNQVC